MSLALQCQHSKGPIKLSQKWYVLSFSISLVLYLVSVSFSLAPFLSLLEPQLFHWTPAILSTLTKFFEKTMAVPNRILQTTSFPRACAIAQAKRSRVQTNHAWFNYSVHESGCSRAVVCLASVGPVIISLIGIYGPLS